MTDPKLYTGAPVDRPLPSAPSEVMQRLLSFLPRPNYCMEGSPHSMHRGLLPYWHRARELGIRLQRLGDHRVETEWMPTPAILRTRRYRIILPDPADGGELLVTTRWQNGRLGIVRVQGPRDAFG